MDREPFLFALSGGEVVGCLSCPPEPPGVAWIRLFAVGPSSSPPGVWEAMWATVLARLGASLPTFAALTQQSWMKGVLQEANFRETHAVLFMEWRGQVPPAPSHGSIRLRPLIASDLDDIWALDSQAFAPLWQHSRKALEAALAQSSLARAALDEGGRILGYSLSTSSALGGHIARLAVHPSHQNRGIGRALMADTLRQLSERGISTVSVNTQSDNPRARVLYRGLGFRETGQVYPVYERPGESAESV